MPHFNPLRAILVCVDYSDLLAITLPYNRHHFSEVMVVTSFNDAATVKVALDNGASLYQTDVFYHYGAVFNKFAALEKALDCFGRHGWMCIMDADVLWPRHIDWTFLIDHLFEPEDPTDPNSPLEMQDSQFLYTPLRRMMLDVTQPVPQEPYWKTFPLHPQQVEWAGYTQIFSAYDPHLPPAPWHQTDWKHAGGADSFFQQLWPASCKRRPHFECLHLGPAGQNWCGRTSPLTDGSTPPQADERMLHLRKFMRQRRVSKSFDSEKL